MISSVEDKPNMNFIMRLRNLKNQSVNSSFLQCLQNRAKKLFAATQNRLLREATYFFKRTTIGFYKEGSRVVLGAELWVFFLNFLNLKIIMEIVSLSLDFEIGFVEVVVKLLLDNHAV